ncbi:MAG: chromate transporter [Lachnospiraceae bacterium]
MILIRLFCEFFKAGLFAIGGGLATLPFLQEISQSTGWFTQQDLMDLIAISESTPGAIGVNAATYAGFHTYGLIGGVVATLGLIAPSILIILLISGVLEKFRDSSLVQHIFYGLRPASTGLIASAGFSVVLATLVSVTKLSSDPAGAFNWFGIVLAAGLYAAIRKWNRHPVVYIGASALIGIASGYLHLFG